MSETGGLSAVGEQIAARSGSSTRLPCRGCRSDCIHYADCDGRPWRTLARETGPHSRRVAQRIADATGTNGAAQLLAGGAACLS
jgi:hypothetical protein